MLKETRITDLRPEDQLLLCCARTTLSEKAAEKIKILICQDISWSYLVQSAIHHRVLPLLYQTLRQNYLNCIPIVVMNELQHHYEKIARRNLFLTAKLLQLIDLLGTHHIPVIPYKGPALAFLAYGNICLRQFGDLDILVHPHDYLKTRDLFLTHGYRLAADYSWECSLDDDSHGVRVDLHRGITPEKFPNYLDFQSLQQHLEALPVAGGKINTFCPEDILIILCIQLAKDGGGYNSLRLSKICDIAELIRSHLDMDWRRVIKKSRRLGCQIMLLVSLSVAHKLLDAPVPQLPLRSLTHPHFDILTTHIYNKLIHQAVPGDAGQLSVESFHFKVRERWRDKLYPYYYDFKLRLIPNKRDYTFFLLPESLNILYYVIRPIRLVRDYGQLAWHTLKVKCFTWK